MAMEKYSGGNFRCTYSYETFDRVEYIANSNAKWSTFYSDMQSCLRLNHVISCSYEVV